MTDKIERKFTEEECVANGGHFWKYWSANTCVDPKTFDPDYSCGSKCVYYPNGEPQYRGCPLCGRKEEEVPARWVRVPSWDEIMSKIKKNTK